MKKTVKKSPVKKEATTRFLVVRSEESFEIEIPSSWKVTYGPMVPGANSYSSRDKGLVLRFYEAENRQRAMFDNVIEFRDLSLPMIKLGRGASVAAAVASGGTPTPF